MEGVLRCQHQVGKPVSPVCLVCRVSPTCRWVTSVGWISPAGNVGRVKFVEIPLQRHAIVFSTHNMTPWHEAFKAFCTTMPGHAEWRVGC